MTFASSIAAERLALDSSFSGQYGYAFNAFRLFFRIAADLTNRLADVLYAPCHRRHMSATELSAIQEAI